MAMRTVGFKAPEALIELLDKLVEDGRYSSRGEAIRVAIRDLINKEMQLT